MAKRHRILVVCATGSATSTMAIVALREAFERANIQVDITQGRAVDACSIVDANDFDLVVSTAGTALGLTKDIPVLNGLAFVTGMGKEALIEKVIKILK